MAEVGRQCVSGEINAKNKMGAYAGFRPFLVDVERRTVAILKEGDEGVASAVRMKVIKDQCG